MPKTLIILAHPNLSESTVNKRWAAALKRHADRFTVHELYTVYPRGKIDANAEQKLIEAHDALVWQFPVYWFNCPPLLKQWLDEVLTHGWAYGSKAKRSQAEKSHLPSRSAHLPKTTVQTGPSAAALPKCCVRSNSRQNTVTRTTVRRLPFIR